MNYKLYLAFVLGMITAGFLLAAAISYLVEKYRQRKHAIWYACYNRALSNSLAIGSKYRECLKTLTARMSMVQETLLEGKCTEEEFEEVMKTIANEYISLVRWHKITNESLGVEADLKEADAYAKEHKLKWGVLYED